MGLGPGARLRAGAASDTGGLLAGDEELFEFTESDASIRFRRHDETITVETDYAAAPAEVRYVELSLEVERFLARVVADLVYRYAELASNPFIAELSRRSTTPA